MSAAADKRLAELRAGLAFASKGHRPAIQALIDALLQADQQQDARGDAQTGGVTVEGAVDHENGAEPSRDTSSASQTKAVNGGVTAGETALIPERAAVADPERKPPEALETAVDGAGNSSETNARQCAPAESVRPRTAPDLRANPVSHGEAGGSPVTHARAFPMQQLSMAEVEPAPVVAPRCGGEGCDNPAPPHGRLCPDCANAARRAKAGERLSYNLKGGSAERLCRRCGQPFVPNDSRQLNCCGARQQYQQKMGNSPPAATLDEDGVTRQRPRRPVWRLEWHPEVVIGPPRPAPVKRFRDTGLPTPFQDDLAAIGDHGSPGPVSRALLAPIGVSTLGGLL